MACSTAKATINDGTVPLCRKCYDLAKGNSRGVKMKVDGEKKTKKASAATS